MKYLLLFLLFLCPFIIAQWVQTNGPYGSTVMSFTVSGETIYAGTQYAGVYISTNQGENWNKSGNFSYGQINSLCSTGSAVFANNNSRGVFRSTDNGSSWVLLNTGAHYDRYCVAANSNTVFAGDNEGIARSADNGNTWFRVYNSGHAFSIAAKDSLILAGTSAGLLRSTDNGLNWNLLGISYNITCFGFSQTSIFAGSRSQGVFRSSNGGLNWMQLNNGFPAGIIIYSIQTISNYFYAGTNKGLFRSTDNGNYWQQLNNEFSPGYKVLSLISNGNKLIAGLSGAGVLISNDNGFTFNSSSTGLVATNLSTIISRRNILLAGSRGEGIFRSSDNGNSWQSISSGLYSNYVIALDGNDSTLFAGTSAYPEDSWAGLFRSTDNGSSWINSSNGIIAGSRALSFAFSGNKNFMGTYYTDGSDYVTGALYFSTNIGVSWNFVDNQWPNDAVQTVLIKGNYIFVSAYWHGGIFRSRLDSINFTQNNQIPADTKIYSLISVGDDIIASSSSGFFRTTDDGETWSNINTNMYSTNPLITDGYNIYAVVTNGIIVSSNHGTSWRNINEGLGQAKPSSICLSGEYLYAGTNDKGVFRRPLSDIYTPVELISFNAEITNNIINLSWKTATEKNNLGFDVERKFNNDDWVKTGFIAGKGTSTQVSDYHYSDNLTEIFYKGKASYRLRQQDHDGTVTYSKVIELDINLLPKTFSLYQNYPNPFNPETVIKYSLPSKQLVTLSVYDVLGNKVQDLVNEEKDAGEYSVSFKALNIPSGVYFYIIHAGRYTETKKLMLLK